MQAEHNTFHWENLPNQLVPIEKSFFVLLNLMWPKDPYHVRVGEESSVVAAVLKVLFPAQQVPTPAALRSRLQ
jgi:hypothetical protein